MRERPILFSGPMISAILSGAKTQTRRIVRPQIEPFVQQTADRWPQKHAEPYLDSYCSERQTETNPRGMSVLWCWWTRDDRQGPVVARCPYGVPGDRLWVRETFRPTRFPGKPIVGIHYAADQDPLRGCLIELRSGQRYTFPDDAGPDEQWPEGVACKTRPSIFLPRWASRITLEVTEVRVQRLQEISEDDAEAEGVEDLSGGSEQWKIYGTDCSTTRDVRESYRSLWDVINSKRAPWASNPWVWALTFRRVEG